jgi:DNA-directed RNA polymerase alpha subunit
VTPAKWLAYDVSKISWSDYSNRRIHRAFRHAGITTVADLIKHTEIDLLCLPEFGRGSLNTVKLTLAGIGLSLKPDAVKMTIDDNA